tara:strand:- start:5886 stop:13121 length:7236 start_codon:yes stop_codon:yes gene_type:complete
MANPFAKFAQPEVEQNPFAQFAQPQEEAPAPKKPEGATSNPFAGMIGQAASLTGAGIEAVAEVAERVGDKLELAVPLSGIPEEDIRNKKQLQPLFDWAKSLKGFDESIGYQPSTQLKELGANPLKAVPFIAERVITSAPDMVAAVAVLPAYVMARTKQILDERVKNDNKTLDDATVGDVTAAATAAVIESTLERFATKGLLKPTTAKTAKGRVAKETGIQAGTEVAEEEAAYLGEAAGTKKGLSAEEALTRGAEAAIVGGGLGAGVQGTKELLAPKTPPTIGDERETILDSLTRGMQEPADLFADQEGGQPAGQPGQQSQVDLYAQRAADALESTNAIAGRGSPVSAKYGDADQTLPPSNEPPGLFEDVESGAAVTPTSTAPAAPAAAAPAQSLEAYSDFVRQYTDLRDEYNSLPGGVSDQAGMNQRKQIQKDLAEVVDANMGLIRSKGVAQQLKNPVFDGSKILARLEPNVGQPKAMQGSLFGLYRDAARRMKNAMALAQQDVNGAIAELEDNRTRIQEKVDSGGFDDATIISMRPAGMSSGQALKNKDSIIQNYVQKSNAEIDQAIDMLKRGTGQPRAMQGNLFSSQQRADTLEAEKSRVAKALDSARAELARLKDLASRPAEETAPRPSKEEFAKINETVAAYERNLLGIERDLQKAQQDVAAGVEPTVGRERQETISQTEMFDTAELQQENARVMRERRAASAEEPREVTERRERVKPPVDEYADLAEEPQQEVARQGATPPEKSVKAPEKDEAIDHARRTPEGRLIISFFDAVESQNQEEGEKKRHGESKNTAENEILEFDLTEPGEFSSVGASVALKYLLDRVGSIDKLRELIGALQSTDVSSHPALYKNYGLPNLSTRRGMDTFRDETLEHFSQAFGTEGGIRIRRPLGRAPATGEFKGVIPYEEDITSDVTTARLYDTTIAGKPREPEKVTSEVVRKLSDNKLRSAALILKQLRDSGGKISDGAKAAITYLSNTHRSTFGQALRDLAFDLAYYKIDPEGYGAGSLFYKEGGQYAEDFRGWIKENLHPETLELLDTLVAEHKQNEAESKKHAEALIAYKDNLKKLETKRRKQEKEEVREAEEAKRKKKTRKERVTNMQEAEVELGESEETIEPFTQADLKNLPTVQQLTEVLTELHPSIVRTLERGDTRAALELLAQAKNNKYYSELARRLLDTGFTAKTRLILPGALESLSNDPKIKESLDERLDVLRDMVVALYPQEQQATIISDLKSGDLRNLISVLGTIQDTLKENGGTESNQQLVNSVEDLINNEFAWDGKYDPASDTIVMRQGKGKLTNHLMLHESIHAAASHLLDNPDRLTGIQRAGYDQLNELFQYSKNIMAEKGITSDDFYGLQDLHEFVSEALTNPKLQALLRSIRYKAAPFSLWNRFTNSVRQLFNVKPGGPSNVMAEVMFAADAMMAGTMSTEGMNVTTGPKAMATKGPPRRTTVPAGMPNQPSTIRRWMMADTWKSGKMRELRSLNAEARKAYLGILTLRQINDLVGGRLPQISNFINVTEQFLARKSQILKESGDISRKWERLQAADPDMSRKLGAVMHGATILEIDPDKATSAQRANNAKLMNEWRALDPEAKTVYREVRNFYERRYSNYKRLMNRRIIQMRQLGVSEATILEIRNEFEKGKRAGPYFPLMRFGRFWYQVGKGKNREYYMFESEAARDMHRDELLKQNPSLSTTIGQNIGNDYQQQMDFHARESAFLKSAFAGVDSMDMTGLTQAEASARRTELKDNLYQTYLANQPDRSMRNAFVHRNSIAGYSEDALRSFASSSFSMAYQMSRFEYSPEMFSQLDAARSQIKGRFTPGAAFDPALVRENDELRDYVEEIDKRLVAILNPTDTGKWVSYLSNIGFVYYLTSIGSAVVNVMGGAMIGVPTLIGQQVRANPKMGYTEATGRVLYNTFKTMSQIMATGFDIEGGGRAIDSKLLSPSLDRSTTMSAVDKAAYNRFVADGIIDITAAYDQSGLASNPTSEYNSIPNRAMQIVAYAFHHAERFNREIIAMSAFRSAMEKRANYTDRQKAFAESVAEAKDLTQRSMFDYSEPNKPRFLQGAAAKIIFQFKQFPQHMTFFLARNAWNMIGKLPEAEKREARARFVGTMGMAGIFSGVTGLWGFSTVAFIVEAVAQMTAGDDDEPFDFELEFANWAVDTFGKNMGTMVSRGIGNAAGVDLHSRLKLDGMWFRDGRNNQDAESMVEAVLVGILGPLAGLGVSAGRAYDLYNKGHADRAIETILPGFAKQPLVAYRYAKEGARTLQGEIMKKEFTPFELMMQSLGIRPADLAEIQFRNIKVKGQEQEILKKRNNVLNIFGLTVMTNDEKGTQKAIEQIIKFNAKYPTLAIDVDTIVKSIEGKYEKSAQTDHGLYIDPKLRYLFKDTYIQKITEENEAPPEENPFAKFAR